MQAHPSSSMFSPNPYYGETCNAYWKKQGQSWRTEPAIDEERQQQLLSYSQGSVDIERGSADIEWLLAVEEKRNTEVRANGDTGGKQQKLFGLDLRGADLSGVNLSDLPLMGLRAGLSLEEGRHATVEQSRQASPNLTKADMSRAQLQRAQLSWAIVDEAVLVEAHLERETPSTPHQQLLTAWCTSARMIIDCTRLKPGQVSSTGTTPVVASSIRRQS